MPDHASGASSSCRRISSETEMPCVLSSATVALSGSNMASVFSWRLRTSRMNPITSYSVSCFSCAADFFAGAEVTGPVSVSPSPVTAVSPSPSTSAPAGSSAPVAPAAASAADSPGASSAEGSFSSVFSPAAWNAYSSCMESTSLLLR